MPTTVEAPDTPPGLQHKSAITAEPIVTTDDRTGEVTAVVSVTNVVDEVGDVILPGAYTATLLKRRPKGVWSHSWKDWVARTEDIREYAPGDPQLKALLDEAGASLPAEAGALVVRCKFNMDDPDSYKAYQKVKFFSETNECQWSIGYSVPPGKGVRDSKGIRKIAGLDLYEYSPVLFGAASQSTSLSVKSVDPAAWPEETETLVPEDVNPPAGLQPVDDDVAGPGVVPEDEVLADNDPLPDLTGTVSDGDLDAAEPIARAAIGDGMDPGGPGDAPVMPDGPDEVKRKFTAGDRDKAAGEGQAMDDGSFPIKNETDLKNAIKAVGRAKDPSAARRHIISRARALGLTALLPDGWTEKKSEDPETGLTELEARLAAVEAKYDTSSVGSPGGRQNWVDKAGGLPPFIRAVAHALIRSGKSKAQAIQIAVGTIRRWASGGGDVTEETRAKAAATIAEWDAKRGGKSAEPDAESLVEVETVVASATDPVAVEAASGEPAGLLAKWDPAAEVGRHAAGRPTDDSTMFLVDPEEVPQLAGSHEERREMLRVALSGLLLASKGISAEAGHVFVDGVWDDEVVVSLMGTEESKTWRVPYSIDGDRVMLGAVRPARISLSGDSDDLSVPTTLMNGVDAAILGAKLLAASPEVKAGRVLSGSNAERIATAVESLIAVLVSAGVQIKMPAAQVAPVEAPVEEKSVAPDDGDEVSLDDLLTEAAQLRVLALRT